MEFTRNELYLLLNAHPIDRPLWLVGANLSGADLSGANLSKADLSEANLRRAYLNGTYLAAAYLNGANLRHAKFNEYTTLPDDTKWSSNTDMARFTDPDHPEFWRPPD